jgi:type II restriction enzyme
MFVESSEPTDFKFSIVGRELSTSQIEMINSISGHSKVKKRVKELLNLSCMLDFVEVECQMFSNNLILIDSALPKIIACMVLRFYLGMSPKTSDLIVGIEEDNLLNFDISKGHPFYHHKVKRLFNHIALGMLPYELWKGDCSLYEETKLDNFLINNTKFEEALKPQHDFGEVYIENKKLYINLNLQIRCCHTKPRKRGGVDFIIHI